MNGDITDELLMRWIQFSALSGMMHLYVRETNSSGLFSASVMQEIRKMTQLRSRLFPYIYSLAHLVRARAENPVRGDNNHEAQFKLGEAFLVAPVYREGDENRSVFFPKGTWYDYWTGEEFEGGQTWLVDAPANQIPLFVKAGSIIPYRSRARQIMEGSNSELTIEMYAGGVGTFRLYEDDGVTNRYRNGEVATTGFRYFETDEYATFTIGRTVGEYTGQPEERSLILRFLHIEKPDQVIANSNKLQEGGGEAEWMYDEGEQLLTIHWNQPTELKTDFEIRF
jgi:alpha-glucosidase (family GH31 glycosyl hydrolase)